MGKKQLATTARMQFEIEGEGDGETVVLTVDVKRKGQWVRIAKQLQRPELAQPGTGLHRARSEPGADSDALDIKYEPANTRPQ